MKYKRLLMQPIDHVRGHDDAPPAPQPVERQPRSTTNHALIDWCASLGLACDPNLRETFTAQGLELTAPAALIDTDQASAIPLRSN